MRLNRFQIDRIAKIILKELKDKKLAAFRVDEGLIRDEIVGAIVENFEAEDKLNDEAHKLLAQHRKGIGMGLDEDKALAMIRRQLAKKKGFVL
ncbi:DUF507 family protein [bacterium]|nr:DUF507 family protein [bacterium]